MLPERFTSKYEIDPASGCWNWTAYVAPNGYGRFMYEGFPRVAHRVAYELTCGPVPDGLELDHLCRNRACVNPSHLEPVTRRENLLRGNTITAAHAARTHCKNGHPLTEDNLLGGASRARGRFCKTCARDRQRELRRVRV